MTTSAATDRGLARTALAVLFALILAGCAQEVPRSLQPAPLPEGVTIEAIYPTIFYRANGEGGIYQVARLDLGNGSAGQDVTIATRMAGAIFETAAHLPEGGARGIEVPVPPLPEGATGTLEVSVFHGGLVAGGSFSWKHQRMWKLHLVPFSHTDVGFTSTQADAETIQKLNIDGKRDSAGTPVGVLEMMDLTDDLPEESRFRFVSESSWAVDRFLGDDSIPQARKELLIRRIREGRFEVGGFYIGHTNKFMGDEALVRSTMFAAERLAREHGIEVTTAIINDVGDASSVASVLAPAGIRYFQYGENTIQYPLPALFHLRAPDGKASVLAWRTPSLGGYGEKDDLGLNRTPLPVTLDVEVDPSPYEGKIETLLSSLQEGGLPLPAVAWTFENGGSWHADYPYDAYLVPFSPVHGADNGHQDLSASVIAREWNSRYAYPRMVVSTSRQFFEYVEGNFAGQIPEAPVDFAGFWGEQIFLASSQLDPAKETKNREFVERMSAGEAFSAFATALDPSVPYPAAAEVREAYAKNILTNDHNGVPVKFSHNMCPENGAGGGLCYTPEDVSIFKETRRGWIDSYDQFAGSVLERAQGVIAGRVRRDDGDPRLVVFNPSAWPRSDVVEARVPAGPQPFRLVAADGSEVPYQVTGRSGGETGIVFVASVPAYGYGSYVVKPGSPAATGGMGARAGLSEIQIENEYYRIRVPRLGTGSRSGTIASIYDKQAGREISRQGEDGLNQYVLMMRSQASGTGILGFDSLQRYRPGWLTSSASLVEDGPVRARLRLTGTYDVGVLTPPLMYGVLLTFKNEAGIPIELPLRSPTTVVQDIILYRGIDRVEFVQTFQQTRPQGLENSFLYSFEIPGWREMRVETQYNVLRYGAADWAGMHSIPEPARGDIAMAMRIEHEEYPWNKQFKWIDGIPTDIGFRHYVDLSGPDYGVAFSSRDSGIVIPMEPGEMPYQKAPSARFHHLAVGMTAVGEAIVGAEVGGTHAIRSAITAHAGGWDTLDGVTDHGTVARWARAYTAPLTAVLVGGGAGGWMPPSHSFASVEEPNVVMPVVKAAEDRDGYVLRLHETAGKATAATVRAPFAGERAAWTMATTGERDLCRLEPGSDGEVVVPLENLDLVTLRVRTASPPAGLPACPVPSR